MSVEGPPTGEKRRKKEHQRVSKELQVVRAANLKQIENNRKAKVQLQSIKLLSKTYKDSRFLSEFCTIHATSAE